MNFRSAYSLLNCLLLSIALACAVAPSALATDFSQPSSQVFKYRQDLEEIIAGKSKLPENRKKDLCRYVVTDFLATEIGKIKYNDLFHEIRDEEQIADIKKLHGDLGSLNGWNICKKAFKLWNAYDDK